MSNKNIIIVGGGLAGLITAIHLTRTGVPCTLIEKRSYPFHRVCGEYISNEVVPYLKSLEVFPETLRPATISRFELTSVNGKSASLPLDLGGFGISRFKLDHFLYEKAKSLGVNFLLNQEAESVTYDSNGFSILSNGEKLSADLVIGSFGKRSKLDVQLDRSFMQRRSPYVGVKYHIELKNFPQGLIALHNFYNGYCGISRVEDNIVNLCYLTHRDNLKTFGSIAAMEENVLFKNHFLKEIFRTAKFLLEKPETINEISFETKDPVHEHILMCGDAAGMITPLCGNGMAMAIHSAKILSEFVIKWSNTPSYSREQLEKDYADTWKQTFARRLWAGRQIQRLFGDVWTSNLAVGLGRNIKPVARFLMKQTHGNPF